MTFLNTSSGPALMNASVLLFSLLLLLICDATYQLQAFNDTTYIHMQSKVKMKVVLDIYPIRIALAVDDNSLKDIIILMNSVVESTIVDVTVSFENDFVFCLIGHSE